MGRQKEPEARCWTAWVGQAERTHSEAADQTARRGGSWLREPVARQWTEQVELAERTRGEAVDCMQLAEWESNTQS